MLKAILLLSTTTFLLAGWFSGMKILWYLADRGIEKSKLYSFNPLIFTKYLEITNKEQGRTGIWFKVLCISFILGMINLVALIVLYGEA